MVTIAELLSQKIAYASFFVAKKRHPCIITVVRETKIGDRVDAPYER